MIHYGCERVNSEPTASVIFVPAQATEMERAAMTPEELGIDDAWEWYSHDRVFCPEEYYVKPSAAWRNYVTAFVMELCRLYDDFQEHREFQPKFADAYKQVEYWNGQLCKHLPPIVADDIPF